MLEASWPELNMRLELDTGAGAVEGRVTRREVEGVVGSGADGSIYAHTGTGGIDLLRR